MSASGHTTQSVAVPLKRWGAPLFVASIMLSAALLFAVEPMFTRLLLSRYGGSAAVWSVAIVFFQTALLAGYLYAHVLTRYLSPRLGALVHVMVLFIGLLFLPLTARAVAVPQSAGMFGQEMSLLATIAASIGWPFMALSANAPLLQAWYARAPVPRAHDPYPLYAASNVGSLVALLAYPFVIEPVMALSRQGAVWSIGYAALTTLVGIVGIVVLGRSEAVLVRVPPAPVAGGLWLRWIGLSLIPSAGLVAVTAHLSTDVAAAPFLWVMPLALYLLTFILAFGGQSAAVARGARWVLPPVLVGLALVVGFELRFGLVSDLLLHLAGFFIVALACHATLAAARPATPNLTQFYVAMSLGGAIGGILAALIAPNLFSFVAEYPLVLLAAAAAASRHRLILTPVVALILGAGMIFPRDVSQRETMRSFFGVHKIEVTSDGAYRILRHGMEIHGAQKIGASGKPQPLTYYHDESPISEAIDAARALRGGKLLSIGVVGLGTGSVACLAEPQDALHFYEIDPAVIAIARDPAKFTFLSGCAGEGLRIIEGDARQTLAVSSDRYDVLMIDAFSSDAIPTHLLTREAMEIYLDRLKPGGMVVLHISNNHLRLNEVVAATARTLGLAVRIHDDFDHADAPFIYQPTVVVLARAEADFGELGQSDEWGQPEKSAVRAWTDDYSNLFGALIAKFRED